MFEILQTLLADKKGGPVFTCFDGVHIGFILSFVALAVGVALYLRKRADKSPVIGRFVDVAFGLYMLDFFLMPFAYGEIDVEKLPFHVCTAMCVMCFVSRHCERLKPYRLPFAMLGFLSNLVYLLYPAGVMWHAVHPFSYRVIQTLTFHGVMMVYGAMVLLYERGGFCWKGCRRDLLVIVGMTAWAWLGNTLYNSPARVYNWFFVVQDPFNMFPQSIAPYIMPILNVVVFFGIELTVYGLLAKVAQLNRRQCYETHHTRGI